MTLPFPKVPVDSPHIAGMDNAEEILASIMWDLRRPLAAGAHTLDESTGAEKVRP